MVELFLVRHAESQGNIQQVFQGQLEYPLSETGEQQLEFLAKRFSEIQIDRAYSSPLQRAKNTASAILKNKNIEIETEKLLIELFAGSLQGRKLSDVFSEDKILSEIWHNHIPNFRATNGESMRELYDRAWNGILNILTDPKNDGKTILVVSHGGPIRCIVCRLLFGEVERLGETDRPANTSVSHIIYKSEKVTLDYSNDISHLPLNSAHTSNNFVI